VYLSCTGTSNSFDDSSIAIIGGAVGGGLFIIITLLLLCIAVLLCIRQSNAMKTHLRRERTGLEMVVVNPVIAVDNTKSIVEEVSYENLQSTTHQQEGSNALHAATEINVQPQNTGEEEVDPTYMLHTREETQNYTYTDNGLDVNQGVAIEESNGTSHSQPTIHEEEGNVFTEILQPQNTAKEENNPTYMLHAWGKTSVKYDAPEITPLYMSGRDNDTSKETNIFVCAVDL